MTNPNIVRSCATLAAVLISAPAAHSAAIMQFTASNWAGGANNWSSDTVNTSEQLSIGVGSVSKLTDTNFNGTGQSVAYTNYSGTGGFVSDGTPLMAGLQTFTITAVIRVGATPGAGAENDNTSWRYNMITGLELGGPGQGEFQYGFSNANTLNVATGLGGDNFSKGGVVSANAWATVAFVLTKTSATTFSYQSYINGVDQGTATTGSYGGGGIQGIANSPFGVGYNVVAGGDREFFTGDIARIRYDDTALSPAQITADSLTFAGLVPEPSTALLGIVGLSIASLRRRR